MTRMLLIIRRVPLAGAAVLAFAAAPLVAAHAAKPLPSGSINCTLSGSATLKPSLPPTLPAKPKKIKLKGAATLSNCAISGVSGGKLPITSGAVQLSGSVPAASASCANLLTPTLSKTKVQVKWQGRNPAGKLATVGVSNTFIDTITVNMAPLGFTIVTQPIPSGAFTGSTITANVVFDDSLATLAADCAPGGPGVAAFDFTGTPNGPSIISVP
jgi:hypothetical protein